jgi:pimeloyl-ACP methyl ester carboxylesterase
MFRSVELSAFDGRRLQVELAGPEDGLALIFHTGTPSAGRMFAPMVEAGIRRGIRHIAYARPGYGSSERQPGRSVADCVRDVSAIAEQLGIERFLTAGWSGGGPHAIACAALLPDRVLAAASMAGVAPLRAPGLDWLEGMGEDNLEEFAAAEQGEPALRAFLEQASATLANTTAQDIVDGMGDLLSEVDRLALSGDFAVHMAADLRAALEHGIWGWFDDDTAFASDWGFDLNSIERPVAIWQGGKDRFVPLGHGNWLAANVPGAEARLHPGHGHLSLGIDGYGEILDGLLARSGQPGGPSL